LIGDVAHAPAPVKVALGARQFLLHTKSVRRIPKIAASRLRQPAELAHFRQKSLHICADSADYPIASGEGLRSASAGENLKSTFIVTAIGRNLPPGKAPARLIVAFDFSAIQFSLGRWFEFVNSVT